MRKLLRLSTKERIPKFIGLKLLEIGIVALIIFGGFYVGLFWGKDLFTETPLCSFKNINNNGCSPEYRRESWVSYDYVCGCDSKGDVYWSYFITWLVGIFFIIMFLVIILFIILLIFWLCCLIYKWIKWNWEMAGR